MSWLQIKKHVYLPHEAGTLEWFGFIPTSSDPQAILLHAPKWTWSITWRYRRFMITSVEYCRSFLAADRQHESYHLISQMTDRTFRSQVMWYLLLCSYSKRTRKSDRFTSFFACGCWFLLILMVRSQCNCATGLSSGVISRLLFTEYTVLESDSSAMTWLMVYHQQDTKIIYDSNYIKKLI